jgi:NADPH-dependent 2,4-dienoyl-CoA reductase/sulfur reductase-like enzyme/rhodanese-related sulfurtransferase
MIDSKKSISRVVIVGGVAGGANVAARLRRLNEKVEIVMFERGAYVSFANCGLPYHIGGEIIDRKKLLVHTPESLLKRFNINVRINSEVLSIDRQNKFVTVKDRLSNTEFKEYFDLLVLSPGAMPIRPAIKGIDLPGIFSLRDIQDMDAIIESLSSSVPKNILVVGGGFIGLEMIEQLHHRFTSANVKISLVESNPHVLSPLDSEMVSQIEEELVKKGINLYLNDPVTGFETLENGLAALTKSGKIIEADFILFNVGVRPETSLAVDAGLEIGARGGIKVDSQLKTSDPNIFALGDCIETKHLVTGEYGIIPLAGPANRQGRIVADVISGIDSHYKGTLGTAILRVFSSTAAVTGASEKTLKRLGIDARSIFLHPSSHASYYPGASTMSLKLIYCPHTRKILGAQAVGADGVDKRIDAIATAIYAELTIDDLTELELCYAPQFSSAKDPVNLAGMVAQNVEQNLVQIIHPKDLAAESESSLLLDVRDIKEREKGFIPSSKHIPLNELRGRLSELPLDKPLIVYCQSGQRSYNACRILIQNGFQCKNLTGAYRTWSAIN